MFSKLSLVPLIVSIIVTYLVPDTNAFRDFNPCLAPCYVLRLQPGQLDHLLPLSPAQRLWQEGNG